MNSRRNNDFERSSPLDWIRSWFSRARRWVAERTGQDDFPVASSDGPTLMGRLLWPLSLLWAFLVFLATGWSTSRKSQPFLLALPALGMVAAFIGLLVLAYNVPFRVAGVNLPDPAEKVFGSMLSLRKAASEESSEEEKKRLYLGSRICAEHVVHLRPKDDEAKFQLGFARELAGDTLGARNVMQFIAPEDSTGHSRAHLWIANDLTQPNDYNAGIPAEQRNQRAIEHLRKVEESPENDEEAAEIYIALNRIAAILAADGKKDEAIEVLRRSIAGRLNNTLQLQAIVMLGQLLKETGKVDEMEFFFSQAMQKCRDLSMGLPDSIELWETMMQIDLQQENYDGAVETLREGVLATTRPEVKQKLFLLQTALYHFQSQKIPDIDSRDNYIRKLVILGNGLLVNPQAGEFYQQLAPFLDLERDRPDEETWIREAFLIPKAPIAILDVVVGTRDMLAGRFSEGQKRWMTAFRSNPISIIVINNILISLSEGKPEKIETFANLAAVAVENFPDNPLLKFTRARLMHRSGKSEQAIQDLEKLIVDFPDGVEPRELLAEILKSRGDTARAEKLSAEAVTLKAKREAEKLKEKGTQQRN